MKWLMVPGIILAAALTGGCSDKSQTASQKPAASAAASALPAGLILTEAPKDPQDVVAAKKSAQPGDEIVVRGRIGGRREPFVENRAIFQLVDSSVPTCADNHGDSCPTPWDYCCEPREQVTAKSITVQIVGPDGKPLQADIKGQGGLAPMARIILHGKVDQKPDENVLIVRADGIFVERS